MVCTNQDRRMLNTFPTESMPTTDNRCHREFHKIPPEALSLVRITKTKEKKPQYNYYLQEIIAYFLRNAGKFEIHLTNHGATYYLKNFLFCAETN